MTDVLVRLTTPSSGALASGWVPADEVAAVGHLECRPYAPDADGARLHLEAPDRLLLPASMPPVRLVAGEALLHLAPVAASDGWCWQIIERTSRGKARYVLVPDSPTVLDYADLVDVDPATLAPTAEPEAAWWAAVEGIGDGIGQAVADYLVANPPTADVTMADLTGHAADTTAVHGIADTSALVVTTDARLSDARTPTAHTHTLADVTDYTAPDLSGYVPTSRKVNGQALTGDITLDAADVGALPDTYTPDLSGYTPTSGLADVATSGSYADLSDKPTIPDSADDISAAPASGQAAVNALTASGTVTVPATHSMHTLTMTQNTTLMFSNPASGHAFTLKLSGAFTPTLPASVTWAGGSAPIYASGKVYVFATFDAGTSWIGSSL